MWWVMTEGSKTQPWSSGVDLEERLRDLEVLFGRLEEQFRASEYATKLQAEEYARRLEHLNGEYQRDRHRQADFVSQDKYEEKIAAVEQARVVALERVDEKFEDYIKRWEQRQREVDLTITTLSKAASEAKQIAENQGRQTREEADRRDREQKQAIDLAQRRQTRNLTIAGIAIAAVVGIANLLPGAF